MERVAGEQVTKKANTLGMEGRQRGGRPRLRLAGLGGKGRTRTRGGGVESGSRCRLA